MTKNTTKVHIVLDYEIYEELADFCLRKHGRLRNAFSMVIGRAVREYLDREKQTEEITRQVLTRLNLH